MSSERKGILFAVSAPSGAGKTTICKRILSELGGIVGSISVTTRGKRVGERDRFDYYFVDEERFREMQDQGELYEWQEIHGHFYGTPRKSFEEATRSGNDVLFDIDTRGALTIKRDFPESCLIFLKPPSPDVLEKRLKGRKTEEDDSLARRLRAAGEELKQQDQFDYVIINDNLEDAVREIHTIIESERIKRGRS
ncbi:MAG: guanylate kinase [Deltaproteobacteria bacterium]|nr:guanylate kinase [Deltaproteobacteria bacterium]